jgi:hypothetical protein
LTPKRGWIQFFVNASTQKPQSPLL